MIIYTHVYIKSFPRLARELNIAPGLPDLTDDIAACLGGNAARLLQLDGSDQDQQN